MRQSELEGGGLRAGWVFATYILPPFANATVSQELATGPSIRKAKRGFKFMARGPLHAVLIKETGGGRRGEGRHGIWWLPREHCVFR